MDKYEKLQKAIEIVHDKGKMSDEEYQILCDAVKELKEKEKK